MNRYITIPLALLIGACGGRKTETGAVPAARTDTMTRQELVQLSDSQQRLTGITTGRPVLNSMHSVLRVNGTVEVAPENLYTISFPMGGYLRSSRLVPGTRIVKGQLLASLEDAQFIQLQQDYLTEQSRLAFLRADFERQEELSRTQANSVKVFQQAKTSYEGQKVLVRALREKLLLIGIDPDRLGEQTMSRSVGIYAPISGYVSKVHVNPGKYVSPTEVLFELIDPSKLHLSLQVFEKDAQRLRIGQKLNCFSAAEPGRSLAATVQLISPGLSDARTVEVHCHFDRLYPGLIPGLFMTAEIRQEAGSATTVPEAAVVRWQNGYYVFVEQGPRQYELVAVTVGRSADGMTEISSPLPDRNIVTGNAYSLLMMLKNSGDEG